MMIDHDKRYIFIHVSKTAGSSIERTLQPRIPLDSLMGEYGNTDFEEKHWSAQKYRNTYPEAFEKYFKFAFVRNPWDRLVSNYNWCEKVFNKGISFNAWIDSVVLPNANAYSYAPMLSYDNQLLVDYVGRFENLQNDFEFVCTTIGLPKKRLLHSNNLSNRPHYSKYYNKYYRDKVGEVFAKDIESFNYKFEGL
jgi:hypothetical protein